MAPAITGSVPSARVRFGNELGDVDEFLLYRTCSYWLSADCPDDKDFKNHSYGKMQLAMCWSGSTHLQDVSIKRWNRFCDRWRKRTGVTLWHMPHGITLLATLKNGNNYYLLFEQPSSCRFHATSCVSSYLCSPSHELFASTKSTRCYFSKRSEGTNPSSSSSYCLHSWCIPHNLRFVTKLPVWRLSSRILQAFSYSSDHPRTLKIFIAEMEF